MAERLRADFCPGTVQLVDEHEDHQTDIILVPPPTDDPNDPLNWSRGRKNVHTFLVCFWTFLLNGIINFYGVAYDTFVVDLNTTYNGLNIGSALLFLSTGCGAALWEPVAMKIGRRPVYLLGTILTAVGSAVGGFQKNFQVWCVFNVIWGLGCGPKEALPQTSFSDLFFAHEIGTKVGYWILSYTLGAFLTPLAAGYIYEAMGWRWCFWFSIIFLSALVVVYAFLFEETKYRRDVLSLVDSPPKDKKASEAAVPSADDKKTATPAAAATTEPVAEGTTYALKSYRQRLTVWTPDARDGPSYAHLFVRPLKLIRFAPVLWASLFCGVSVCWWAAIFTTQALFFTAAPYDFDGTGVGLTNVPALAGALAGAAYAGGLSDRHVLRRAARNGGVREPEQRLALLAPAGVVTAAGLLLYGVGVARGVHWAGPCAGIALLAFGFSAGSSIATTYALDSYRAVAADSLALINLFRNAIGMAFTLAIQPWLLAEGRARAFVQMLAVCVLLHATVLPVWWCGKRLRLATKDRYLQLVRENGLPLSYA